MLAKQLTSKVRRRGVTLVEMMVAIAVTLIMIVALTQAFQSISESVSDSRAMITITEATRKTAMTLQRDLDGLTVPARPWPEVGSGLGYLEIVEGWGSDMNPQPTFDFAGAGATPTEEQISNLNLLGDFDDLIMFTSRRRDEPFVGRMQRKYLLRSPGNTTIAMQRHEAIDSPIAEVIWWTNFDSFADDGNPPNGLQDSGEEDQIQPAGTLDLESSETIVLRRRNLLIRPDLNNAQGDLGIPLGNNARRTISDFLSNNDLSIRIRVRPNGTSYLAANSLADLTRRENRAGHWVFDGSGQYQSPYQAGNQFDLNLTLLNRDAPPFLYRIAAQQQTSSQYTTNYALDNSGAVQATNAITGDAAMLTNVLGFDIRVYDPNAPIVSIDGEVAMSPSPRMISGNRLPYPQAPSNNNYTGNWNSGRQVSFLGRGDFVDLNYGGGNTVFSDGVASQFSGGHAANSVQEDIFWLLPTNVTFPNSYAADYPAFTYDTWSWDYERDGYDQDADGSVDEGIDGVDTPLPGNSVGVNGVDDVGERETTPPYPHPLRGVQITIRVHDQSTRQVRQFSVVSDFTPE